jgi:hypothetical protein
MPLNRIAVPLLAHVHVICGYAGSHAARLSDVKGLFRIVTALVSEAIDAGAIRGNTRDDIEGVGLASALVVGVHVLDIKSELLEQPDVLAGAGESGSAVVGRPHVAAAEGLSRTGARSLPGRPRPAPWDLYERARASVSNSCPNPKRARVAWADRRWARGLESRRCGFPGDPGRGPCSHGKPSRYSRPSRELHVHRIAGAAEHLKAAGLGESDQGVVIFLAGPKPLVNSGTATKCRYEGLAGS